jgi:hypothetical protein
VHHNLMSKGSTHFNPAWFHAIIRISSLISCAKQMV